MLFRDTGILAKKLKGIRIFLKIFKGIQDTWINFSDMGIQCFLNFGDICHISFRDGIFFKIIKGIWDTGTPPLPPPPFQGLISIQMVNDKFCFCVLESSSHKSYTHWFVTYICCIKNAVMY